jgi:transcriptional regulator with XRE-family HTH domain
MPPVERSEVGKRIAAARAVRHMTQRDLAIAAAVSLSMVRKIEQGSREAGDQVLVAISDALDVPLERLTDRARGRTDSRVHAAIPALRTAVANYDLPEDGPIPSLADYQNKVEEATRRRLSSQYAQLAKDLPSLISAGVRMLHAADEPERQDAARLLTMIYRSADAVASKYGYIDLSDRIIQLMRWASNYSDDPLLHASVAYVRTETFFANNDLASGLRRLELAIDATPAPTAIDAVATRGALHMRAAVVAGAFRDANDASMHIAEAYNMAQRVPEGVYFGTAFGPSSVHIHDVSTAIELGQGKRALEIAQDWAPSRDLPAERRSHYYVDLAHAQLWQGLRSDSFESLQVARRIAPQHVREHPRVREALVSLLRQHLAPPEPLVSYAIWANAI